VTDVVRGVVSREGLVRLMIFYFGSSAMTFAVVGAALGYSCTTAGATLIGSGATGSTGLAATSVVALAGSGS